jgi:hypothetical membrane protein
MNRGLFLSVFDWRRAGSWCGLAGPVIFAVLWIVAIASTPRYDFGGQWVSDLGVGEGAAFFNSGVIVAGFLNLFFTASLAAVLRPSRLGILGSVVLALAGIFLMLIGVFTENAGEIHGIVSISFFLLALIALLVLALPLHRSPAMRPWTGLFTIVIAILGIMAIGIFAFGPLTETIAVALIVIWSIVTAWKLRHYLCVDLRRSAGTSSG